MTTYRIDGFVMVETSEGALVSSRYANILFTITDGSTSFSTTFAGFDEDGIPFRQFDVSANSVVLDATYNLIDLPFDAPVIDFQIIDISWGSGNTTTVANIFVENPSGNSQNLSYVFEIGGDDLPDFASDAQLQNFVSNLTSVVNAPNAGVFGLNKDIAFAAIKDLIQSENDDITGTDNPESLFGGLGNDTIDAGAGGDYVEGGDGNDRLRGGDGDDVMDGGNGQDRAVFDTTLAAATVSFSDDIVFVDNDGFRDELRNIELLEFSDQTVTVSSLRPSLNETGSDDGDTIPLSRGDDTARGGNGNDTIDGGAGDDKLFGDEGDDTLDGGDGNDTINGGVGNDTINGGSSENDLRDTIFGGDGDDVLNGGYGNDQIFGMDGNDTISGGFGADELQGQNGNDVITGSGFSDLVFGGAGDDFVNGGFGYDRINGGSGADKFYHLGVFDHGSDWVQDYNAAEGDVLVFGNTSATADQFQVNFTHTASLSGERSGDDNVQEAFVIYKPTGQIIWALVDGEGQSEINLQIGSDTFDLMA